MINKNKKNKGSSLLIVVAMFAILSILIMSVLAMTTSGYNMRIKSNQRIENFYGADSGLDITQSLLYKYLNDAINYANGEVDKTKPMKEQEKKFKESFIDYIRKEKVAGTSELFIEDEMNNLNNYGDIARANAIDIKSRLHVVKKDKSIVPAKIDGNYDENISDNQRFISIMAVPYEDIKSFEIYVESKFIKDNKEREVAVTFEIGIPEYGQELVKSKLAEAPNILNYIIGVDGNYTLENIGATDVYGDLWVKGKTTDELGNPIVPTKENKYENGIIIKTKNPKGEIGFKGNINTFSTLKIDNTLVKFEANKTTGSIRDIFARNIVINNVDKQKEDILGDEVDLYVYNDLVLNGKNNNVKMNNFYGLNDINSYKDNYKLENTEKSSSIIVNTGDYGTNSKLTVKNDAYILGTPYVDLGDAFTYQTGQAISVNNVMRPYTFKNYQDGNEYTYDYKGNLHLIDKKNDKELTLEDKKNLFDKYYTNLSPIDKVIANGTNIEGNIYSVGGILNKGELITMNKVIDITKVKALQSKYVQEVFNMGAEGTYTEKDFWNKNLNSTVNSSFDWDGVGKAINDSYPLNGDIIKVNGNSDFIHLKSKMVVNDIINHSKAQQEPRHPLSKYGVLDSVSGKFNLNIILSNSDKPIRIISKDSSENKIIDNENEIIYEIDLKKNNDGAISNNGSAPLLVIAKNDVILEDHTGFNFSMIISGSDAELKLFKETPIIGNYGTPSSNGDDIKYEDGQYKIVNELFKYALENSDIMGEIGNEIFQNGEEIVSTNAIEVSHLINKKNWKLNK